MRTNRTSLHLKKIYCFGFLFFSKNTVRAFFSDEADDLVFLRSASAAISKGFSENDLIACWGKRGELEAKKLANRFNSPIWRVEDGFVRSTGLGSDYLLPVSLAIDKSGIYYDASMPSDIENMLQYDDFNEELLDRAYRIKKLLVDQSISKYNLGCSLQNDFKEAIADRIVLLIPGQVEDDASIQKGTVDIKTNTDLIKSVRASHKEAFIIYKPHPDVVSGNRMGMVSPHITQQYCDLVLDDVSITECLALADEVHTMTSLVGLEALMRDCKVYCYGLPFYAGWGLTHDSHQLDRRTRKLTLDQLIAATYILYPRYINWQTEQFCTPELAIEQIASEIKRQGGKQSNKVGRFYRQLRKLMNMGRGIVKGLNTK